MANKLTTCYGCSGLFMENRLEFESRKRRVAAPLCPSCLAELEKEKQKRNMSPLYYIGEGEPIIFSPPVIECELPEVEDNFNEVRKLLGV